jgi:hypothetical protein
MHLVEYLKGPRPPDGEFAEEAVEVEYRLACSGELYNRRVVTADWRKSDITRVLLREPFELFVASRPFDDYPQELCARLELSYITEREESRGVGFISNFLPDNEIMEDLCSILSLLARRLISIVGKLRERRAERDTGLGSYGWDAPVSVINIPGFAVWRRRPISIITSLEGQRVEFHNPPPTGVDPQALRGVLLALPHLPAVEQIIHASRLYKTALELIENRPDITYQLLISAIETMAGVALPDYKPEQAEILETQRGALVREKAQDWGLDQAQAEVLALEACRDNPWATRKFKKFILDNVSADQVDNKDAVFPWWSFLRPSRENFEKTLGNIYSARSGNLHRGNPFPRWIGVGTSPTADPNDLPMTGLATKDVPPVTWFERVVSNAVRHYLIGQCAVHAEPFSDFGIAEATGPE